MTTVPSSEEVEKRPSPKAQQLVTVLVCSEVRGRASAFVPDTLLRNRRRASSKDSLPAPGPAVGPPSLESKLPIACQQPSL
mmetsp:Transcript_16105/g.33256  ORF Transcript_16105/g.33256 Transcript_16105/m.33256 type:complete len:81 (-) Transcript_16105:39-281(-)